MLSCTTLYSKKDNQVEFLSCRLILPFPFLDTCLVVQLYVCDQVLIQLGDILDRGEDEIAILSLLRSLDTQAKAQGGAVFQVSATN